MGGGSYEIWVWLTCELFSKYCATDVRQVNLAFSVSKMSRNSDLNLVRERERRERQRERQRQRERDRQRETDRERQRQRERDIKNNTLYLV